MNVADKVSDVAQAVKGAGFQLLGHNDDGWLKFQGAIRAAGALQPCELYVDSQLFELPKIRLLQLPKSWSGVVPHVGGQGHLCYIAKGTVVLDIFDPVGQTLACIRRAEEVLDSVLKGEMVGDLAEEFYAYWGGSLCLVDVQNERLGRQKTLLIKPGDDVVPIVTDDETRTANKLKSLGWTVVDYSLPTYRVRTTAKPRPQVDVWPPATVSQFLTWQGLLDKRCRKKLEQRLQEGFDSGAKGALVLIESPLLTYGVTVVFKRQPTTTGGRRHPSRTSLYQCKVTPVSVVRIDDRYMAQRNIPGLQTLAGKRLVLVGCGTIGGYLAEMLVKAGAGTSAGQLTLVDFDSLYPQNIGRHRLGFPHLFGNKSTKLREELQRSAPGVDIRALPVDVKMANLGQIDLLIDATGEESLGHWLSARHLPTSPMLSVWVEGPGTAVRALLRTSNIGACFRCLCDANRKGFFTTVIGNVPTLLAGQGCEGLYVPFPASVSVQAASLAAEMVLDWVNGAASPALRTRLLNNGFQLATPDCDPPRMEGCPACPS